MQKHASYLLRPNPLTHFASIDGKRVEFMQHSPRKNRLLAALPPEDYERLLPDLEFVPLLLGRCVYEADEKESYLYFLTEGIVCRLHMLEDGTSAAFAVTGNEGVIGIAAFLGGESTPADALVVSSGYAYRLRVERLKNELAHHEPLHHLLHHYTQALIAQAGQIAVCNQHHSLEQRLCMWILLCFDRLPSNELAMTQELISNMLGVRREGVTQAAGTLQKAGLIHSTRGHISVLDRPKLEAQACECYSVVKRQYDRLLAS